MALVGYVRVSALDQDTTTQLDRVNTKGCKKVFSEKESGTSTINRTALVACLDYLREGDSLVVTKIDRLARSARDLHNLVHDLEQRHISLLVLDQSIDTSTPHGRAFLGMLATFAEFETNIRKERQLEGIAAAKAKGKYNGRKPTAQNKAAEIMALVDQGMTKPAIAAQVGVSVASVYNVIKKAKAKDVQYLSNEYRMAQASIVGFSRVRPDVIEQLTQQLISKRLIVSPYRDGTGMFYTEDEFKALAKHLNIPASNYDAAIAAFQDARELNRLCAPA